MNPREYRRLMSESYSLAAGVVEGPELEFWLRMARESPGPILELGSGTGRILIPLLQRGLDVTGIDTSAEMTGRCLENCRARGLVPTIHQQPMQELSLPNRFALVILGSCGLGLLLSDEDVARSLARVWAHLLPKGRFVLEIEPAPPGPKYDPARWSGNWVHGPGGVVIASRRIVRYDPVTHLWENLTIFDKFVDGRWIEAEANERAGRYFTPDEVRRRLEESGFERIEISHWLGAGPPRTDSEVLTVTCHRPG